MKAAYIQAAVVLNKAHYTHTQVISASKVCFLPDLKQGIATVQRLQGSAEWFWILFGGTILI